MRLSGLAKPKIAAAMTANSSQRVERLTIRSVPLTGQPLVVEKGPKQQNHGPRETLVAHGIIAVSAVAIYRVSTRRAPPSMPRLPAPWKAVQAPTSRGNDMEIPTCVRDLMAHIEKVSYRDDCGRPLRCSESYRRLKEFVGAAHGNSDNVVVDGGATHGTGMLSGDPRRLATDSGAGLFVKAEGLTSAAGVAE